MKLDDLLQRDPFGEKLITITGHNLNQTQIDKFLARMSKYGGADYDEIISPTTKKPLIVTEGPQVVDTGDYRGARVRRQPPLDDDDELPSAFNIYDTYVELNQFTSPYDALWIVLDLEFDQEENSLTYETIPGMVPGSTKVCRIRLGLKPGVMLSGCRDAASSADAITKIYACATMWHETPHEMTCMLKSIFRMDEDQCARRNAQKYLKVIDPDYYEFEAHIFFDDAFDVDEFGDPIINKFVRQLIDVVDQAASAVHQTQMRLKPPKKVKTPYGGRLQYILPGKNKLTVHLKDKNKIRHRKRWSQVMYLYYLLGYRLMMKVDEQTRKEVISENTFILTLDGDVDFTPQCVHLLVWRINEKLTEISKKLERIERKQQPGLTRSYYVAYSVQGEVENRNLGTMTMAKCTACFRII
ncbi:hypothetical protein NECAME_13752 [Necator americanus]|uniref:Uncharacterized protein n=1 Tax=Necator americanus TaxID=51031 RepID=W2SVJ2_NECAM|nr:hypothetical protein NECAME_13752 [Necator americanus]ETN72732.1 hypothetical protein NECAME_13752 [Necator americanus]